MTATPPFLTRVRISGYKSITACDVEPGHLAFLVGPNGSGKSNFLDAIRFVTEALSDSPERVDPDHNVVHITPGKVPDTPLGHTLEGRGGIRLVHQQMGPLGFSFAIRLDFLTPLGLRGHYSFQVGANEAAQVRQEDPQFVVEREECAVVEGPSFSIDGSTVEGFPPPPFPPDTSLPGVDRSELYLHKLARSHHTSPKLTPFRNIHSALARMCSYNLRPDAMRRAPKPAEQEPLRHDGANVWTVLGNLRASSPETFNRIEQYLSHVVPGLSLETFLLSPADTAYAAFEEEVPGQTRRRKLPARSMSDGTLRAVGILTALLQEDAEGPPSLVAIEEPEVALHPAAVGVLLGAMRSASQHTQVLVTTHSPELLHSDDVRTEELLAVSAETGMTVIGGIDVGSRDILADRLFSPGELLRLDQLEPDSAAPPAACDESDLFEL